MNKTNYRRKNSHNMTVRSCCRYHQTLFLSGCADLRAPVFYKLLPPEKRTNYSVLDKLVFFAGQFVSKKKSTSSENVFILNSFCTRKVSVSKTTCPKELPILKNWLLGRSYFLKRYLFWKNHCCEVESGNCSG